MSAFKPTGRYGPLSGAFCTCPEHCTDKVWGDGPRPCDPECVPCRIMAGKPYAAPTLGGGA